MGTREGLHSEPRPPSPAWGWIPSSIFPVTIHSRLNESKGRGRRIWGRTATPAGGGSSGKAHLCWDPTTESVWSSQGGLDPSVMLMLLRYHPASRFSSLGPKEGKISFHPSGKRCGIQDG
ncbi:hypothetical protein MC885_016726 [Smutsia gigantea]|nr:hypothetical protein MC885_016726 [Smutsia gigantea]